MNGHSCKSCAYWVQEERRSFGFRGDSDTSDFGLCRRQPPVLAMTERGLRSWWPRTRPEDWCGEHAVPAPAEREPWVDEAMKP